MTFLKSLSHTVGIVSLKRNGFKGLSMRKIKKQLIFIILGSINHYLLGSFLNWNFYWFEYIPTTDVLHRLFFLGGLFISIALSIAIGNLLYYQLKDNQ